MLSASAVVDCSVCRSKLNIIIRGMIKMVEMVSLWKLEQMLDKYLAYQEDTSSSEKEQAWDMVPQICFIAYAPAHAKWIVADNVSGEFFMEEFIRYKNAIAFLRYDPPFDKDSVLEAWNCELNI